MNYLPGANLLTRQLRTGIIFYRFLILIFGLFPPMDKFFKIIYYIGIQTCNKRLITQSARDIVVPPMPATTFQPQLYEVIINNTIYLD